jgi:hypothetical protein
MQAIIQAGQEWITRFGIDFEKDREADVKLEVARRKQVVFVAVYNRCLPDPYNLQTDNPTDTSKDVVQAAVAKFNRCLEREEKLELAWGNVLTEPPQPGQARSAYSKTL